MTWQLSCWCTHWPTCVWRQTDVICVEAAAASQAVCMFKRSLTTLWMLMLPVIIYQSTTSGWTTAHQYPTLPIVNGYVLPVVMKSLFHVTGSVPMDIGHLPLLARLSGTLCPRTCGIRRFLKTGTDSLWRRFYLRTTSVFSVLAVFLRECAI